MLFILFCVLCFFVFFLNTFFCDLVLTFLNDYKVSLKYTFSVSASAADSASSRWLLECWIILYFCSLNVYFGGQVQRWPYWELDGVALSLINTTALSFSLRHTVSHSALVSFAHEGRLVSSLAHMFGSLLSCPWTEPNIGAGTNQNLPCRGPKCAPHLPNSASFALCKQDNTLDIALDTL